MPSTHLSYADVGVDIALGNTLAQKYLTLLHSTFTPNVPRLDNGFGGLYSLKGLLPANDDSREDDEPILVSGADGVGTKLKIAFMLNQHATVGIDLVAMSVNDVLVQGARPLFFLDYIGCGKCEKEVMLALVAGVAAGCREAGCALIGGETAEMPGFYPAGEYDLAGFAVGLTTRRNLLTGAAVRAGDVVIGLAASGLHSNGFSLARQALLPRYRLEEEIAELGMTLGAALLTPTRIYVKSVLALLAQQRGAVHALAHITGGGLLENPPRVLPADCSVKFVTASWQVPPIFRLVQQGGDITENEMRRVFNLGLGMIVIVAAPAAAAVVAQLNASGETAMVVGEIVPGEREVIFA
jgi:phosphoribosylformylglycinamidine cyclo-ligase